jgi:hypothetical protein
MNQESRKAGKQEEVIGKAGKLKISFSRSVAQSFSRTFSIYNQKIKKSKRKNYGIKINGLH